MKMNEYKIRNAHCAYYEGQTGLCRAKEFVKCNPVNCKLYTIDELSTIVDLQNKLQVKEQECDKLKFNLKGAGILGLMKRNVQLKKALDDIEINISEYQGLILGKPRTMRESDCIYNILNIIDKVKELK